jgi:hypothetical protein
VRFAYADPPYVGQSKKHYGGAEVNHRLLIAHLCDEFPDGWVLSAHAPSLRQLLPLCPDDCRVSPWVKPFASFKPNVNPGYCWEPVIWRGGRKKGRDEPTVRRGLSGVKPDGFCFWIFDLLGMRAGDELADVFPGSGAVTQAWARFQRQRRLIA